MPDTCRKTSIATNATPYEVLQLAEMCHLLQELQRSHYSVISG
jgi:hypothetical protein